MSVAPIDMDKLASLSDEELEKLSRPELPVSAAAAPVAPTTPAVAVSAPETQEQVPLEGAKEEPTEVEKQPEDENASPEPVEEQQKDQKDTPDSPTSAAAAPVLVDPAKKDGPEAFQQQQQKDPQPTAGAPVAPEQKSSAAQPAAAVEPPSVIDYKAFYNRIMSPIKANGKHIQLENADEVVQLIQMGANYTKKMQELQHVRKFVMMLQNNGLLDENKLSYLIDLDKKNPEAIKKLLMDAKIDPVELDVSNVNYRNTGTHAVSDQEVALNSVIDDLNGQEGGAATLQSVHGWDAASKQALWENPQLLHVIHQQQISGIYAKITAEMDRRQALGQIPPSTPFLAAYKKVGDELAARGAFGSVTTQPAPAGQRQPVSGNPVAVRPAPVKAPDTKATDPRVRAAAPTRTSPRPAQVNVNYLAMSDEEFMKLPQNKNL